MGRTGADWSRVVRDRKGAVCCKCSTELSGAAEYWKFLDCLMNCELLVENCVLRSESVGWLVDLFICFFVGWLVGCSVGWSVGWSVVYLFVCLFDGWLVGWLDGRLFGWMVSCLFVCLFGWLVGCLDI